MIIPLLLLGGCGLAADADRLPPTDRDPLVITGCPTDHRVALSISTATAGAATLTWRAAGADQQRAVDLTTGRPTVVTLDGLDADAAYTWDLRRGSATVHGGFHTQRPAGATFRFTLQGDSHPERPGKMFHPDLYRATLAHVAEDAPDFHVLLGDDNSIERLIEHQDLTQDSVDRVYDRQRRYLAGVGGLASIFLVNGNHEQAGRCWLDGTDHNPAVLAGRARVALFPLPEPDGFYTGDDEAVPFVGRPRDYYAWTWGDALFAVIDPYWHSPVEVDHHGRHSDKPAPKRDLWQVTLGEAQYRWLSQTLLGSHARWKFVFAHHVLGTGRGGVEVARSYEWGDRAGFAAHRPGWDLPIHDLFVKAGVTVFFQGHDHLYAHQELDGVVYQETPNPADDTYQIFNQQAYTHGDLLPNSGHLRVEVGPTAVEVAYRRTWLPGQVPAGHTDGEVATCYRISPPQPMHGP